VRRAGSVISLIVFAGALVACGDDDDEEAATAPDVPVVTQTDPLPTATTPTTPTTETAPGGGTKTAPSSESPSGEAADLPLCSEVKVRPCRTKKGSVLDKGGADAGEISDLPLCSEVSGPQPCRTPDGQVVEPERL
jgi:hypothetical protein